MANEYDFQNAMSTLQQCLGTLTSLWNTIQDDWSTMGDFTGPKRDELNAQLAGLAGSKDTTIRCLTAAIELAETRRNRCLTYRQQMQQYAAGARTRPYRPPYCDEIYV